MSEPIKTEHYCLMDYLYARAREAEALVAELSIKVGKQQDKIERHEKLYVREGSADAAWKWGREVGKFLLKALRHKPGHSFDFMEGSRLFTDAIALGITPEPDVEAARLKARDAIFGEGGCACPPEKKTLICPKCGGRKI